MTATITLPCTTNDLERILHTVCDHHGCWDTATVTATTGELIISYEKEKQTHEHKD